MVATRQSRYGVHPIDGDVNKAPSRRSMDFGTVLWLSCNNLDFGTDRAPNLERIAPISDSDEDVAAREQGDAFLPRFDSAGLLTAIAQDAATGEVLMVAFMDAEALNATRETGFAHFHSRSRRRLWKKGETSGHVLVVEAILVDCDQDALVLKVRPAGPACHTGARSCFYRALEGDALTRIDG